MARRFGTAAVLAAAALLLLSALRPAGGHVIGAAGAAGDADGAAAGAAAAAASVAKPPGPCDLGVIARALGVGKVSAADYDPTVYNRRGRVSAGGELDCSGDAACCWRSGRRPATVEFRLADGAPDKQLAEAALRTPAALPTGLYLAAETPCAAGRRVKKDVGEEGPVAEFVSCTVPCADGPVVLQFRYWTTSATVRLEACIRDAYYEPEIICKEVDVAAAPGPATVTLPRGVLFDIVIRARGFAPAGDLVILDDIKVNYTMERCNAPATTAPPLDYYAEGGETGGETGGEAGGFGDYEAEPEAAGGGGGSEYDVQAECLSIDCDFEAGDTCAWLAGDEAPAALFDGHVVDVPAVFAVHTARLGNWVTGIRTAAQGEHYLGAYLLQTQTSTLTTLMSSPSGLGPGRLIAFRHYEATTGVTLRACCDGDCAAWQSDAAAGEAHMVWLAGHVACPEGTVEVSFECEAAESANQGACGIDHVRLVDGALYATDGEIAEAPSMCA